MSCSLFLQLTFSSGWTTGERNHETALSQLFPRVTSSTSLPVILLIRCLVSLSWTPTLCSGRLGARWVLWIKLGRKLGVDKRWKREEERVKGRGRGVVVVFEPLHPSISPP